MRGQVIIRFDSCLRVRITPADAGTRMKARPRITPADAGTSPHGVLELVKAQDHPRGCGDKATSPGCITVTSGSPPRMRGQENLAGFKTANRWITPADAGTRSAFKEVAGLSSDHPRGCGDKQTHPSGLKFVHGSPPRMRGQGSDGFCLISLKGITPADAGTRLQPSVRTGPATDHPRGCGDKKSVRRMSSILRGSPPRMRGQGKRWCHGDDILWITPADAGTSGGSDHNRRRL